MMQPKTRGKALLIGIDHYPHFPDSQLGGAQRDAQRLRKHLTSKRGFRAGDIELLCNGEATRRGIRLALERLLERAHEDDCVLLFFAGHGTRRWQPNPRRADDYLNCIVPSDSAHQGIAPNLDITGEELSAWLRQLKKTTKNILLIFDCCHSGALLRKSNMAVRQVDPDQREDPGYPDDWPWPIDRLDTAQRGTSSVVPQSRSHTVLAACRISELAQELNDAKGTYGAFTHHLLGQLSISEENTTYRDLIEGIRLAFRDEKLHQSPQIEGAADRLLFKLEELHPMHFFSVLGRENRYVQLDGGTVHRLTQDSKWQVFPPATKVPSSAACLGTLQLKTLGTTRSEAEVLEERFTNAINPGCRAVLTEPGTDWLPMPVRLDSSKLGPDLTGNLEAAIRDSPWLCLAPSSNSQETQVTTIIFGDDQKTNLAILDNKDRLRAPCRELRASGALRGTVNNLEKCARYRRTLDLKNPDQNLLEGKVHMALYRKTPSAMAPLWIPAEPRGAYELPDFYDDEDFLIKLTNLHDEPVFLYVLDFGVGGAIDLLYPEVEDQWRPIAPGHTLTVGERLDDELTFYLPDNYPYESPGASASGIETLKLLATLEATDFRNVFQESLRSGWTAQDLSASGNFGRLLSRLFLGDENREVRRRGGRHDLPWTTLEVSVRLIRRENPE